MRKKLAKLTRKQMAAVSLAAILIVLIGLAASAGATVASDYSQRFFPNTFIAGIDVSGKTREEAAAELNQTFNAYVGSDFTFVADGKKIVLGRVQLSLADPDFTNDFVRLETDTTLERAFRRGHTGPSIARMVAGLKSLSVRKNYPLLIQVNKQSLREALKTRISPMETPVSEPILKWNGADAIQVLPGKAGRLYDLEAALDTLEKHFHQLKNEPIMVGAEDVQPSVSEKAAEALRQPALELIKRSSLALVHQENRFALEPAWRAKLLAVQNRQGKAALSINRQALDDFLKSIVDKIEVPPEDAKFELKDGRVAAFQQSRDGLSIDREALVQALESDWIEERREQVNIPTTVVAPRVRTAESNDLGIKELLGVGTSDFSGSPTNRVKNIRNSVRKLNGILIKPDEEFSLLNALKPFTAEGGYLPEKVIKGNRIVPEIGGGACQIGTTTFRAAMMSGLPITERQNHSLVVRYYNDPSNKNPGTDATIYEPSPDFRFKNDTGHYILFLAAMDEVKGELRFSFWGTSDGRKGYYSKPVVSRWYSGGEAQEIKTTDLAPGERDCQSAFKGADASFTYTVERPDGTKEDRVFTSHYRALPQICMVGATPEEVSASQTNGETIPNADVPAPATNTNQPAT